MTEGRQPFTAEIKTLAKGPSTYDPLENTISRKRSLADGVGFRADLLYRRRSQTAKLVHERSGMSPRLPELRWYGSARPTELVARHGEPPLCRLGSARCFETRLNGLAARTERFAASRGWECRCCLSAKQP